MLKEIGELRERLAGNNSKDDKTVIIKKLRETELKYNLLKEPRNRRK